MIYSSSGDNVNKSGVIMITSEVVLSIAGGVIWVKVFQNKTKY